MRKTPSSLSDYADDNFRNCDSCVRSVSVCGGNLPSAAATEENAINNTLKTRFVKLRLSRAFFSTTDSGLNWSTTYCLPAAQCNVSYNMDEVAKLYQANGWSMVPMFRHDESQTITTALIDEYVNTLQVRERPENIS